MVSTVMIVDDVFENLNILRAVLTENGYRVLAFPDGAMALKAASRNPPDLILLDIMMPEMDGFEVARRLKADERLKDVPIIFLTAVREQDKVATAFSVGAVDYLTKPFRAEEILVKVNLHIELYKQRQELKKAYERLKNNESFLHATLNSIADAVITCDVEGRVLTMNPSAETITGWALAQAKARPIHEICYVTQSGAPFNISAYLEKAIHEEKALELPEDIILTSRDGRRYHIAGSLAPIMGMPGNITGIVIVLRDVTDGIRRDEELRKLAQAVKQSPASIVITDKDGTIEYVNPKFTEVTGYSFEEAIGQNPRVLKSGEQSKEFYKELWETITSGREWRGEFHNKKKNGELYWEYASISPIKDQRGVITHFIAVKEDITQRKQMEDELRRTNSLLEEAIEKANEMALKAELASKAKSIFLANMSHEIRTPLNAVIGMTALLLDTQLTEQQRHYAQVIKSSGEALLDLINDILDYSKIEAGKLELESTDFDLEELLDDTVIAFSPKAQEKGLELIYGIDPDVPLNLKGDPVRLRQILNNLISNAIKFTHKGEVSIRVTTIDPGRQELVRLKGDLGLADNRSVPIRFTVRDTGIGIPADKIRIIFDKFTQVDTSTTRRYGGTGLGLAISKQLVELMGGKIGVESAPGQGSVFWFTAFFEWPKGAQEVKSSGIHDLKNVRALVVDDNATSLELLVTRLSSWGMRPSGALDGPSALKLLYKAYYEGDPFLIAIIDTEMPGMDGIGLAKAIQGDPHLKDLKIILTTPLGVTLNKGLSDFVFSAYLPKPIRYRELLKTIVRILKGGEAQDFDTKEVEKDREALDFYNNKVRILLAEDNLVNQEVALAVLQKLGVLVDVVSNGKEALEAVMNKEYDLVLMDVQMPEMDGLEATKRIREWESGKDSHIPIIAMTAHAMEGDREMCLKAGMDEHISKPFTPKALSRLIGKWLRQTAKSHIKAEALSPLERLEPTVWDKQGLLARLMGDQELARKIIKTFISDFSKQLEMLKRYLEARDISGAQRQAHTLKGAAANVGAEKIRAIATTMENMAKAGDLEGMKKYLNHLAVSFDEFKATCEGDIL